MLRIIPYIFSQEIYGDNGRIYQIKIYKEMSTPNYGCVGATYNSLVATPYLPHL